MDFKKKISLAISEETGIAADKVEAALETPPDKKMGDYAFPCFMLAKEMKKAPPAIATELAKELDQIEGIERVESNGPYLNFFVATDTLAEIVPKILSQKEKYGLSKQGNKTFMVEFFHANTHKGVHIGHIRNICLGESLCRILEASGLKVIRVNYQGDIGPHVAKAVWGYLNFHKGEEPDKNRGVWLGKIYAEANQKIKGDEKLEQELRELTKHIYDSDKYTEIWQKTRQWCLDDFETMYKDFGVNYDRLYFESEVEGLGREIVKKLVKEGIAEESEGAIIIDMKKQKLGVYVILRSDGVPLYSTKDLALAELKAKEYPNIDKSVHVVGKEQELYFKQLFETFRLYGGPLAGKSHHVIYELVMLPEGKMSSRDGTLVFYEDLRQKLIEYSEEEVRKRHDDWSEDEIRKTAKSIAFSALKFSMLNRDNLKTLVFNWERALDFEGETGPYIQYTLTRINSVIEKHGDLPKDADLSLLTEPEEKALISEMARLGEVIVDAAEHYKPLVLCKYLVELSQTFNEFYHKHQVLKASEQLRDARLLMLAALRQVISNGLKLLGIDALERM